MAIKSKSRQKKFETRIDFTPMVDMNMLLITFFMLCTTMIKSQTLQIALPSNEKVEQEQQNKVKQSEAVTIIIDGKVDMKALSDYAIKKGEVTDSLSSGRQELLESIVNNVLFSL